MTLVVPAPVEEFGGTVTSDFWTRNTLYLVPIPQNDFRGFTVHFRRGNDVNPGPMYIGFSLEDEDFVPVDYATPSQTTAFVYANSTVDVWWPFGLFDEAEIDRVRWVGLHAYASGIEGQNANLFYTFDAFLSITFEAVEMPDVVGVVGRNQVSILG